MSYLKILAQKCRRSLWQKQQRKDQTDIRNIRPIVNQDRLTNLQEINEAIWRYHRHLSGEIKNPVCTKQAWTKEYRNWDGREKDP